MSASDYYLYRGFDPIFTIYTIIFETRLMTSLLLYALGQTIVLLAAFSKTPT